MKKNGKVPLLNGEISFNQTGEGAALVCIHAGFSDHRDWKYQVEAFSKKYLTIVYDQRGAGNSSVPITAFWPADDLKALMDDLKIEKTILIGHSVGGTVAVDFALQYPDRVSALVLVASGLSGHPWSQEYKEWEQSIFSTPQPDAMTNQTLSTPFYATSMAKSELKAEIKTITRENMQKILTWQSFDIRLFFPNQISELKNIKIPTLIVYGDKDSQDIKKIAHTINDQVKSATLIEMKNTDHLLNFENPEELNSIILDFLLQVPQ